MISIEGLATLISVLLSVNLNEMKAYSWFVIGQKKKQTKHKTNYCVPLS